MMWLITAHDGTWVKSLHTDVRKAINYFLEETKLPIESIETIEKIVNK